ncbi:MAG: Gfo/Idh/MocA family oxidoreductase [Planctomycetes bacterium]|nr:Gfo/Idh/MocA family oxidoreductase [Planctomycetota bacterium]
MDTSLARSLPEPEKPEPRNKVQRRRSEGRAQAKGRPVLNVAMVGHAFMGRAHSNAMRQVNRFFELPFEVVPKVVVGRHPERVEAARDRFGFEEASVDLAAVLAREDIHLVDVATPNDSHASISIAALKAGKHVMCEKPLAMDLKEARAMARLAASSGRKVGLWHNYRRCPAASLAQRMIARGDIGAVRQVRAVYLQDWLASADAPWSWRNDRAVCGSGAHGDLNAHLIDMTRFLTGLEFAEVCGLQHTFTTSRRDGAGAKRPVDVDDAFAFLARLSNGAIGTYEATRVAPGRKNYNRIEISGETGSILWNLERMNELEVFRYDAPADGQGFRTIMCMDSPHPYAGHWWPDGHIIGYEHTFVHTLADFVANLKGKKRFAPDFDDGVAVQAVLDAAVKSAQTRRWVKVPG